MDFSPPWLTYLVVSSPMSEENTAPALVDSTMSSATIPFSSSTSERSPVTTEPATEPAKSPPICQKDTDTAVSSLSSLLDSPPNTTTEHSISPNLPGPAEVEQPASSQQQKVRPGRKIDWPVDELNFLESFVDTYVETKGSKQGFFDSFLPLWWLKFPAYKSGGGGRLSEAQCTEVSFCVSQTSFIALKCPHISQKLKTYFKNKRTSIKAVDRNIFQPVIKELNTPSSHGSTKYVPAEKIYLRHDVYGPLVKEEAQKTWDSTKSRRGLYNHQVKTAKKMLEEESEEVKGEIGKIREEEFQQQNSKMKSEDGDQKQPAKNNEVEAEIFEGKGAQEAAQILR